MRGLLSKTTKRAWRTAFACALASCGLARADEPTPVAPASPAPAVSSAPAPADLSAIYRDAYMNPNCLQPPGGMAEGAAQAGMADRPVGGIWTNMKRWKFYAGCDYLRWVRTGTSHLALTSVSRDLFWDDPNQQALGALNAEGQPNREGGINPPVALFPGRFFPMQQIPPERYTPNDPEMRANVNEFLVPGVERLSTDALDIGRSRSGIRPKIGVEFANGDRFDISYFTIEDVQPPDIVDNVATSAFLMKQISSARINPFVTPPERVLDAAGGARFGMFRFGYIDAPFTITAGATAASLQSMIDFRGEDNRHFAPPPPNNWFPHFPYNEIPQPTVTNDPNSPLLPLHTQQDQNGIRSSDIPREPTTNDFPGQSFIFRDGELAVATFRSDIQGAEAVYRKKLKEWNRTWYDMDLLIGLKWVNTNERFTFFFADLYNFSRTTAAGTPFPNGGVTLTPNVPQPPLFLPNDAGLADPVDVRGQAAEDTQITIDRKTSNCIFGPQIGLDVRVPFRSVFEVQMASKFGIMLNDVSTTGFITRGDGLIFADYTKSMLLGAGIWDGQLGVNFYPHPNIRIGGGFEWLQIMRYAGAVSNQATDLSSENRPKNHDNVLYSGWYVGGEIKY